MFNSEKNEQSQKVSDGSTAIQAQEINIVGLSYSDVKAVVKDLFELNFPKLKSEALELAKIHVNDFSEQFFRKMSELDKQLLEQKFVSPDMQFALNSVVQQVARFGEKSKSEVLTDILINKVNSNNDFDDVLYNQAIEVTGKLTLNQIKILSFQHILRSIQKVDILSEEIHKKATFHMYEDELIQTFQNTKMLEDDRFYLGFIGVTNIESIKSYSLKMKDLLTKTTGISLIDYDENSVISPEDAFSQSFPKLANLIVSIGFVKLADLDNFIISPLGDKIATSYLKSIGFLN